MNNDSVAHGSAMLIAALKHHHPEIIERLIEKNDNGSGSPNNIPEYDNRT